MKVIPIAVSSLFVMMAGCSLANAQTLDGRIQLSRTQSDLVLVDDHEEGFVSLFNGTNLNGWVQKNGTATYEVVDKTIVGKTAINSPNSFLCTVNEYSDFELRFQVKVHKDLNSGVQIRSLSKPGYKKGRVHGPQVEIEASPGESGYIYSEGTGRNWISPEQPRHEHLKNGQWNSYRIIADGPRVQTWINGHPIEDLVLPKVESRKGFIGLQVHGVGNRGPFTVQWRNIRVLELDGTETRTAFAVPGTPKIDGVVDKVWGQAPRFLTTREVADHHTLGEDQEMATAEVRCLWDDEFLYCLAVVKDSSIHVDADDAWKQDSVEWFIDKGLDQSETYDDNDGQFRTNANGEQTFGSTDNVHGYESKASRTRDGYVVECRFKLNPVDGQKIGFDVQVNNNVGNGERESTAKWNDATNESYRNTTGLGVLEFRK